MFTLGTIPKNLTEWRNIKDDKEGEMVKKRGHDSREWGNDAERR